MHLPLRFKELKRILSANIIPTLRKNKNLHKNIRSSDYVLQPESIPDFLLGFHEAFHRTNCETNFL
jgi:invasion protein IalB